MLMLDSECAAEENSIPLVLSCIFLFIVIVHIAIVMIPTKFQSHDCIRLSLLFRGWRDISFINSSSLKHLRSQKQLYLCF
jgi:hypothetical protein